MYSCICFLFFPTVSTKYPRAQKCLLPYLYLRLACRSNIIRLLLPFRYPIICDTLYFGGILISIWIWSLHSSASIISTPSADITAAVFFRYPLLSHRIFPSCDIWVRIRYGIDISTMYGLNYLRLYLSRLRPPHYGSCVVGKPLLL